MIGRTSNTTSTQIAQQAKLSREIAKLQDQVSTGKRLSVASDDPTAAARVAQIRQAQANNAVYAKNADTGTSMASAVDTQLTTIASALDRANEILLTARSDTSSASNRTALATELRSIAQDLAAYANATDSNGNAMFPDSAPIALPISDTRSVAATVAKSSVFTITTSDGVTQSISDFLNGAATRMDAAGTNGSALATDIATMTNVLDHISGIRTEQGLRAQRFNDAADSLANGATDLSVERKNLEDTDLTYALSEVQSKQLSLQAAQTLFAQTHKNSLFDIIG